MAGNTIWSFLQHLRFVRGVRIDGLLHDMVLSSPCFLVLLRVSLLPLQKWFVAFQLFFVGAFYVFAFLRQPAVFFFFVHRSDYSLFVALHVWRSSVPGKQRARCCITIPLPRVMQVVQ